MPDGVIEFLIGVVLVVLIGAASLWYASAQCHAQWEGSGLKTEWSILGACKVQRKDGTWVPSKALREMSP